MLEMMYFRADLVQLIVSQSDSGLEVQRYGKKNKKLSYRRETARQLRIHAQLTRCFSAVAI